MVIGITGGIGSGKSTVSAIIKELGYPLIDCDEIAHEVFLMPDVNDKIKKNILNTTSDITRGDVSKVVFNDSNKMEELNAIMQPVILERIKQEIAKYELCFVDCPLLYEEHLEYLFDDIILVYVSRAIQIKRIMKRDNISKDEAIKRLSCQISMLEKLKIATANKHYVIYNNVNLLSLKKEIEAAIDTVLRGEK